MTFKNCEISFLEIQRRDFHSFDCGWRLHPLLLLWRLWNGLPPARSSGFREKMRFEVGLPKSHPKRDLGFQFLVPTFWKCLFGMLNFCICLKFHSEWQPRFYYSGTVMVLFSEKQTWFWSRINGLSFQSHFFLQTFFKKPWSVLEVAWKVIQNG